MVQNLIYNLCESFVKNIDGIASITKNTLPQEEILAPATFEVTANYVNGYYWATFYTSMANYQAPDGVLVQKVNFNGSQFTSFNVEDGIINKRQGVVLRSSTSSITLTKTYSKSSDDYSNNSLIGTDYQITNPGNAYVLNYKQSHGLSFYRLSSTGRIKANAAYLIKPITYLTQWKIVGNSEVHTDPFLTSWKVSGNSIVDNNTILSCGDLGQDGKYHVKISNGVTIYDIPLDAPLRKVGNIVDTIEFPSGTDGKAMVTRNFAAMTTNLTARQMDSQTKVCLTNQVFTDGVSYIGNVETENILCDKISTSKRLIYARSYEGICFALYSNNIWIRNGEIEQTTTAYQNFFNELGSLYIIYELATPTTELVDAPQISISPTDTYTSANDTPYSSFEHTENKEIWSCGEYNATDGKYHILVQPLGGSIADIALDEPLRKVNDVADTIEFPSETEGKALVTRKNIFIQKSFNGGYFDSTGTVFFSNLISDDIVKITYVDRFTISICNKLETSYIFAMRNANMIAMGTYNGAAIFRNYEIEQTVDAYKAWLATLGELDLICQLATPTTELVDAPQIEEADSYSMVISQGGKAVEWSGFETE